MPNPTGRSAIGAAVLAAGVPGTGAAWGQAMTRGGTGLERPRPELDPLGIRSKSFLLYPDPGIRETCETNIFATDSGEVHDFITPVEPSLDLRSDWNNHALNAHQDSRYLFYADDTDEKATDCTAAMLRWRLQTVWIAPPLLPLGMDLGGIEGVAVVIAATSTLFASPAIGAARL